jgi:hypothetical protein
MAKGKTIETSMNDFREAIDNNVTVSPTVDPSTISLEAVVPASIISL